MIIFFVALAVLAVSGALVLLYWKVLKLTFPEKLPTDEVFMLTTEDLWKLRVCRYRKGRTNGQPVLLVHGANVNQHTFTSPKGSNLVEYLVERGFDCWTVDLRGCHSSEAPFERHRDQIAVDDYLNFDIPAALRLIQQETGYAKIHYCGQSLGGMLLYAYVMKFGAESIASAVTLGSPLGFDGVKIRRSNFLVSLISFCPPLSGAIARGFIPFAMLLRTSPIAFPINMRNLARGMNTGSFYNMLEDPLPGVLRDLVRWVNTPGWRMDGGQLDVQEGLKTLDVPLFAVFAPLDPFVPLDKAKAFFEALPSDDKRILIASRELGCKRDYNHCDLAFGLEGPREIFGPIARWFETHSTREQIYRSPPVIATGYQAPLRASERAEILSGDSYARRAATVSPRDESEALAEIPETKAPVEVDSPPLAGVELDALEPMILAESPDIAPDSNADPVEISSAKAKAAPKKSPPGKPAAKKKPSAKKPAAKSPVVPKKPPVKKSPASKAKAKAPEAPGKAAPGKSVARTSAKAPDLASVSAALTALRPSSPKANIEKAAPIRVKQSEGAPSASGKNDAVETPKSVLKALSNASDALEAFKKPEGKSKK